MQRIMITGPTGTIGMALIQKCIEEKKEVLAICRKGSDRLIRIPKHPLVTVVECSLSELRNFDFGPYGTFDAFYHLAWEAPAGSGRNDMKRQLKNVEYTLDAVEVAKQRGCSVFIGAGSQAEYGRVEGKLSDKTPTFPENGYGMAKLCAGQMSRVECQKRNIRHIWTRILSVYGPYDAEYTMVMSTIQKLLKGEKPALTWGEQQWDYLYCKDAAEALYLLGEQGNDGTVYCIGSGKAIPLKEYIQTIRDCINPELELGFGEIPYSEKQVMNLCADLSNLTEDTGFYPRVKFDDGIRETIQWIKENQDAKIKYNDSLL